MPYPFSVQAAVPADASAIVRLGVVSGLFPEGATDALTDSLDSYFRGALGPDHAWLIAHDEVGQLAGVVYYAPDAMADRVWHLYMIAVRPERQRRGLGRALVDHVEAGLAARGQRLLIVETSGLASFERTRGFYRRCGFDEEARLRDYYRDGEDKVIFRRVLRA